MVPFLKLFTAADSDDDSALTSGQAKQVLQGLIGLKKELTAE